MRTKQRTRPCLEALEDRWVPATVRLVAGNLFVSNPAISAGAASLTLTATGTNQFQVMDGTKTVGTFNSVGNVFITGSASKDTITVNLNGNAFNGNLQINGGNGNDTITVTGTGAGNRIGGNVLVNAGLGDDTVNLNTTAGSALTIGGSVQALGSNGNNTATVGNGGAVTQIGGNLSLLNLNNVQLTQGQNDVYGGDVTVTAGTNTQPLTLSEGVSGGTEVISVGGNFNITGGAASDTVFLRGMTIGKNLNANLGGATGVGGNQFAVSKPAATVTTVNGDTNYSGGSGVDTADLRSGAFHGNVTLNLGDGNDQVLLASFGAAITTIDGNLTVYGGNGDITITNNTAVIGGNASFYLGNGNNTVSFDSGGSVGGTIFYHSGNGNSSLTLAGAETYLVFAIFGNGDDTLTLNNAAAVLTGYVDGGGSVTGNTLTVTAGTLGDPLTVVNFP